MFVFLQPTVSFSRCLQVVAHPRGPTEGPPGPSPAQILEIWEPGNPEIWNPTTYKKWKFSKSNSMSPKMSARSGLAGKRTCRPHLGPSQVMFSMDRNNKNYNCKNKHHLFPLVQWANRLADRVMWTSFKSNSMIFTKILFLEQVKV